jgi:ribosome assembly protein YihI (activator of Der GTPase)
MHQKKKHHGKLRPSQQCTTNKHCNKPNQGKDPKLGWCTTKNTIIFLTYVIKKWWMNIGMKC